MVTSTRRDHHDPVGLGPAAGQLGDRHRRGDADRAGDPLLVVDPGPQLLGDLRRRPEAAYGPADVEERLVEGDHLHQWRHLAEGLHHRGRDGAERVVVGRDDHRLRAGPSGAGHRHRRADAVLAGEVVGREHHPALAAAHDHGYVDQVGAVADHHGRVEGVHVDVEQVAGPGVVTSCSVPTWARVLAGPGRGPVAGAARRPGDRRRWSLAAAAAAAKPLDAPRPDPGPRRAAEP